MRKKLDEWEGTDRWQEKTLNCHFRCEVWQGPWEYSSAAAAAAAKPLQSCLTLSDPTDCSLPGSSVHGIFQARVPEWGAIAFSNSSANAPQIAAVKESGDLKTVKVNNGDRADFSWKSA